LGADGAPEDPVIEFGGEGSGIGKGHNRKGKNKREERRREGRERRKNGREQGEGR